MTAQMKTSKSEQQRAWQNLPPGDRELVRAYCARVKAETGRGPDMLAEWPALLDAARQGDALDGEVVPAAHGDQQEARAVTDGVLKDFASAGAGLARAWKIRAHRTLGYASWTDYLDAEFGGVIAQLSTAARRGLVVELRRAGMSTRAIAPAVGVDQSTVARDARVMQNASVTEGDENSSGQAAAALTAAHAVSSADADGDGPGKSPVTPESDGKPPAAGNAAGNAPSRAARKQKDYRDRRKADPGEVLLRKITAVGVACLDARAALGKAGIPEGWRERIEAETGLAEGAVAELAGKVAELIKKESES